jgi:hypothetical protein
MANFDNDAAGRALAEALVITRMASGAWVQGHMAISKAGNTIVRFQRPMAPTSATTKGYGAWTESRADDEA